MVKHYRLPYTRGVLLPGTMYHYPSFHDDKISKVPARLLNSSNYNRPGPDMARETGFFLVRKHHDKKASFSYYPSGRNLLREA
jgi:hypothetical protein